jgi:Domain of unknown function (DUF1998)
MTQSPPKKTKVGELRPSQILFTYGIGAVADLPNLSAMVMGLEDWNRNHTIELSENRLLAAVRKELGHQVKQLLSPPMPPESSDPSNPFDEGSKIGIPVAPFPTWMVCPRCRLLAPLASQLFELKINPYRPNETRYVHKNCSKTSKPPAVIPARFLVACERGHLDDFPWSYFVHHGQAACPGPLYLEERGVSGNVTDIFVRCKGCDIPPRSLSDAFGDSGKKNMPRCRAHHPHLRSFDEDCKEQMKSILLGASNSWFSITLSALSIPVESNVLGQLVERNFNALSKANSREILQGILAAMQAMGQLQEFANNSLEDIWNTLQQQQQGLETNDNAQDLKTPEWEVFSTANPSKNNSEFQLRTVAPPVGFEAYFEPTVLVERLREVRALIGFTRIQSPGDFADTGEIPREYRVSISRNPPTWVPTTEVKGEGIFLRFQESFLQEWEQRPGIRKHEILTREAHKNWLNSRNLDPDKIHSPSIRYLLIHSFSHALMRQLSIECGYNAASLRERIYSKPPEDENGPQAGLLIYTATPDSEGTLGGLVHLGEPKTLGHHISQALEQMRLCASDPLCAEHKPMEGTPTLHWAACHACLFAPETSCERGNQFLDRTVLVPTLERDDLAFFELKNL